MPSPASGALGCPAWLSSGAVGTWGEAAELTGEASSAWEKAKGPRGAGGNRTENCSYHFWVGMREQLFVGFIGRGCWGISFCHPESLSAAKQLHNVSWDFRCWSNQVLLGKVIGAESLLRALFLQSFLFYPRSNSIFDVWWHLGTGGRQSEELGTILCKQESRYNSSAFSFCLVLLHVHSSSVLFLAEIIIFAFSLLYCTSKREKTGHKCGLLLWEGWVLRTPTKRSQLSSQRWHPDHLFRSRRWPLSGTFFPDCCFKNRTSCSLCPLDFSYSLPAYTKRGDNSSMVLTLVLDTSPNQGYQANQAPPHTQLSRGPQLCGAACRCRGLLGHCWGCSTGWWLLPQHSCTQAQPTVPSARVLMGHIQIWERTQVLMITPSPRRTDAVADNSASPSLGSKWCWAISLLQVFSAKQHAHQFSSLMLESKFQVICNTLNQTCKFSICFWLVIVTCREYLRPVFRGDLMCLNPNELFLS